jgi:hypothetical protein
VKNIGDRYGGAITAALFLAEFVGDTPWCHLDVAGTAYWEKAGDYWPKGATGSPARTIIRYVLDRASEGAKGATRSGAAASRAGSKASAKAGARSSAKATRTTVGRAAKTIARAARARDRSGAS